MSAWRLSANWPMVCPPEELAGFGARSNSTAARITFHGLDALDDAVAGIAIESQQLDQFGSRQMTHVLVHPRDRGFDCSVYASCVGESDLVVKNLSCCITRPVFNLSLQLDLFACDANFLINHVGKSKKENGNLHSSTKTASRKMQVTEILWQNFQSVRAHILENCPTVCVWNLRGVTKNQRLNCDLSPCDLPGHQLSEVLVDCHLGLQNIILRGRLHAHDGCCLSHHLLPVCHICVWHGVVCKHLLWSESSWIVLLGDGLDALQNCCHQVIWIVLRKGDLLPTERIELALQQSKPW